MKDNAYYPSVLNASKYSKYFSYLMEYARYNDWKSLWASLRFMIFHKSTSKNWRATSALGTFEIRGGTTDFQFINYTYEKKIREYLKKEVAAGQLDVFVDVGACIGEYCVWLGRQNVYCIAFEPVNHAATRENIRLNQLTDKVKLFECGLGSRAEKVNFNIMSTVTGSSHINRDGGEGNIPIARFDDLTPQLDLNPNQQVLIKLDVEGMETEVLEGMRNFITAAQNLRLIFEWYDNDPSIHNKLREMGSFRFEPIDEHNILAVKIVS